MPSRLEHDYESRRTIHIHSMLLYIDFPFITFILGHSGHYSLALGILHCSLTQGLPCLTQVEYYK
jgi:hypothetical protein